MAPEKLGSLRAKSMATTHRARVDDGLKTLRYEETLPAKPPIPVTVAPPRAPPTDTHPALREIATRYEEQDPSKRDSGLAPTTSTVGREGSVNTADENSLASTLKMPVTPQIPKTPNITKSDSVGPVSRRKLKKDGRPKTPSSRGSRRTYTSDDEFSPITTPIPSDNQLDLDFMDQISFSNRGSVLLGGKKAINGHARQAGGRR